jgi:hypothetical protein
MLCDAVPVSNRDNPQGNLQFACRGPGGPGEDLRGEPGFTRAAALDGGVKAWREAEFPLEN